MLTYIVSPRYFETMRTRRIEGRDFTAEDGPDSPLVAIVNEAFVRDVLKGRPSRGVRIRLGPRGGPREIVGVVATGKYQSLGESPKGAVFLPARQAYNVSAALVVRTGVAGEAMLRAMDRVVAEFDPTLPLFDRGPLREQLGLAFLPPRLAALVLSAFGLLASGLAAIGIFGVVAYTVAARRREIGIRRAVGAAAPDILRLVVGRTGVLVGVGACSGLLLAFALAPALAPVLYATNPRDVTAVGLGAGALLAVALLAAWLPARRALRLDPAAVLREE